MAKNSWWWAERLPETCRVVIPIKLEFSTSVGFIHKESVTLHGHTIVKPLVSFSHFLQLPFLSSISRFSLQAYWPQDGVLVTFPTHGKCKGKFHLLPDMKAAEVYLYSFFNLDARWGWVVKATPRPFYLREWSGTHCIGSWVGHTPGLNECRKSRQYQDSIPGPSSP